jgi:hypothetical protein
MTTTANSIITPQAFDGGSPTIGLTNGNGTAAITVVPSTTNGCVLRGLNVYSTDTATGTMTLNMVISAVVYPLVTTVIPIQAGNITGTPPVNLLSAAIFPSLPKDAYGNPVLQLPTGASLTVAMSVAPTSGKVFTVTPINMEDL